MSERTSVIYLASIVSLGGLQDEHSQERLLQHYPYTGPTLCQSFRWLQRWPDLVVQQHCLANVDVDQAASGSTRRCLDESRKRVSGGLDRVFKATQRRSWESNHWNADKLLHAAISSSCVVL